MRDLDQLTGDDIENYLRGYFRDWEDARMENPECLEKVQDYYSESINIFRNPNLSDATIDFSKPYRFDATAPGVIRKADIWQELVVKFVSACPGLVHDPKMMTFRPLGEGIWEAWVFYDFRTEWPNGTRSVATVSIYTIDMNQVRAEGERGRMLRVINILHNPI